MKILKKAVAAAMAAGLIVTATSCADTSWSYKDEKNTLPIGAYIYYMAGAYSYAQQTAQSEVEVTTDAEGATEATEAVDVMSAKIKDEDGKNEKSGKDYILDTASKSCKSLLYTLNKFDELGLKLTDDEQTQIDTLASQSWTYNGKSYETFGVSQSSYRLAYAEFNVKYEDIFKAMYGKGGEKEVTDDELQKYYTKEYIDYSYLPMNLYETVESTDESSDSSASSTKALSDDEIKKAKDKFEDYSKQINDGKKTFDDIDAEFMKDQKASASTATTNQEILDKSSAPADIIDAVKELKDKQSKVITVGEGDTAIMYLVYRGDINDYVDDLKNEDTRYTVLTNMKSDEYNEYMDKQAEEYKAEKNDAALSTYTPEELEKKMKELQAENSSSAA